MPAPRTRRAAASCGPLYRRRPAHLVQGALERGGQEGELRPDDDHRGAAPEPPACALGRSSPDAERQTGLARGLEHAVDRLLHAAITEGDAERDREIAGADE